GAIEHAALEQRFEIALLARRQRVIEQHQVRAGRDDQRADLFRFAAADEQTRIRCATRAGDDAQHVGAGGARERLELAQLVLPGRTSESDAYEKRTFAAARTLKHHSVVTAYSAPSSSPAGKRIARAGTTVEIACL